MIAYSPLSPLRMLVMAATPTEEGAAIRTFGNVPRMRRDAIARRTRSGGKRTPKVETMYADLIQAGLVKVVRRRGKPPLIQWVK